VGGDSWKAGTSISNVLHVSVEYLALKGLYSHDPKYGRYAGPSAYSITPVHRATSASNRPTSNKDYKSYKVRGLACPGMKLYTMIHDPSRSAPRALQICRCTAWRSWDKNELLGGLADQRPLLASWPILQNTCSFLFVIREHKCPSPARRSRARKCYTHIF